MEKLFAKIATKGDSLMFKVKQKVKKEGKKKVQSYKDKLPNEDTIKQKLEFDNCDSASKRKKERMYNKIKNFLKKIQKGLTAATLALGGLLALLEGLNVLLTIIDAIITVLNVILKVLKIIIKIAKIVTFFLGGTGTGGPLSMLTNIIKKAEEKIEKWITAVQRAAEWIKRMLKKYIDPIKKMIKKALALAAKLLAAVTGLIAILELLYLMLMQKCALTEDQENLLGGKGDGSISGDSGDKDYNNALGLQGLLTANTAEEIMSQFGASGNQEYIRHIRNARFETIGYERFNAALGSEDITANAPWPVAKPADFSTPEGEEEEGESIDDL
tara:strand:+ start:2901 stop:3887 length:987 start_codon:yes stop_codon:yes gene_type:complete